MQRFNRSKVIGIVCVVLFVWFLVFTDSGSSSSNFRANTEAAIANKRAREKDLPLRGPLSDEDLTKKTNAELQGIINSHSQEKLGYTGEGSPGRQKQQDKPATPAKSDTSEDRKTTTKPKAATEEKPKPKKADDDLPHEQPSIAQEELDEYLKSPVVIFSKSYCPHSKRAKHLLLEVYDIKPKPLVVELDMLTKPLVEDDSDDGHGGHGSKPLGKALQDLLGQMTGRKTVPNIIVGGKHSIGGNDNIWALHESGTLIEEIQHFGGRRIISVDLKESED